ncbi:MAG: hypothetical protein AB7S75_18415 [Desulfococcaceae bacterium]
MSIRLIARDLYRLIREAEEIQKKIEMAPYEKRAKLEEQFRKATAEIKQMRDMLDGQKDRPLHPKFYR